jgi:hypothetical protein
MTEDEYRLQAEAWALRDRLGDALRAELLRAGRPVGRLGRLCDRALARYHRRARAWRRASKEARS